MEYQGIIKNIGLSLDINARKRIEGSIGVDLYSRDIETGVFEFTFINEEESPIQLDETYAAKIMVKFHNDENMFFVDDMKITGNVARFVFPHSFIRIDGKVTMYIYLTKGNKTSDVAAITFDVNRSEIDKFSTEIYQVYDKNYEEVLAEFEEAINLTRDEWTDMAEKTRNFVSLIEGKTVDEFVELKMDEKYNNIEQNYITKLLKNEQDIVSTNAQLAQKASKGKVDSYAGEPKSMTVSAGAKNDLKPFVSFVDDDGNIQAYDYLYPLFKSRGITGTAAITASQIGTESRFMTKDHLIELQDEGWEIASHNYEEVYFTQANLTLDEIDYQARKSKEVLSDWGLRVNNYVYTGGQVGVQGKEETIRVLKRYYRSAFNTTETQNNLIKDYFWINRINGDRGSFASLKSEVDKCLSEKNWLVIMIHARSHSEERKQIISDLIDYIQSLNIDIGTLNEGLDIFGSTFNIGAKENITILNNGEVHGDAIGMVFRSPSEGYDINENTLASGFEQRKITVSQIRTSDNIEMPSAVNEGTLTTFIGIGTLPTTYYQTWQQYNQDLIYKRKWLGSYNEGVWGEWYQINTLQFVDSMLVDHNFGIIPAYSTVKHNVDYQGINPWDIVILNPTYEVSDGIVYSVSAGPNQVRIRMTNISSTSKNPNGQPWRVNIIRRNPNA